MKNPTIEALNEELEGLINTVNYLIDVLKLHFPDLGEKIKYLKR